MKVIDLINNSKKTAFSFEILPPLKGHQQVGDIQKLEIKQYIFSFFACETAAQNMRNYGDIIFVLNDERHRQSVLLWRSLLSGEA